MSIQSELTRIEQAKINIKTAINTKGGNITNEKLDQYSEFIINLSTGGSEFYKCVSVNTSTKTWSGYKAVLTNGVYTFEETITEGLSYSAVTPEVGTVYSANALGEVKLWTGGGINYNDYALVNGSSRYTRINTNDDNDQDNYPVYFDESIREDGTIPGAGMLKFNTTLGKWEHIVPSQQNSLFHRAKTTGINGLTGEWEKINDTENLTVEYDGVLPEWNGTPGTGDKEYVYTVTTTSTDYADAAGDYYLATAEEMMELYPQTPAYGTNGAIYYTNGKGYMINTEDTLWEWTIGKYYSDSPMDWKWDTISTNTSKELPDTGNWNNGFDVVAYSGGGDGGDKEYELTVSDATGDHAGANGNYWRIDPPANMWSGYNTTDYSVWTNGTYYIAYCPQYWMGWTIVNNIELDPSSGTDIRAAYVMASSAPAGSTPVIGGWSDVTVTLYSGSKEYKYTVTGFTGGKSAANGDYWQIDPVGIHSVYKTDLGVYTNGTYYLAYCNAYWTGWCMVTDFTVDPLPMDGSDSLISPGPGGDSPAVTWAMFGATVAEYVG